MLVLPVRERSGLRQVLTIAGFTFWCALATVAAATLTGWHQVGVRAQTNSDFASGDPGRGWHVKHYLSADCAHSREIARYLIERRPSTQATEEIVLIGFDSSRRARELSSKLAQAGFRVNVVTAEKAASEGVEVVPMLQVIAPGGRIRFRGGYRDSGTASAYLDARIVSGLMASRRIPTPRAYGCAISSRLRGHLSPFNFSFLEF